MAAVYEERFMDLTLYNDTYDEFCRHVSQPDPMILEIGCGPGNISRYILSRRRDFKLFGIDLAPNMVQLAMKNNPSAEFGIMDCRNIRSIEKKFNGIICGFCMPYLSIEECTKLILDCADLLEKDGILYFSVIEGKYEDSAFEYSSDGKDRTFVHYYSEEDFLPVLKASGFEVLNRDRKEYAKRDGAQSFHLIFIVRKNGK